MSKFARVMFCIAALTLCMATVAWGQKAITDQQGRSVTVTAPKPSGHTARSVPVPAGTITIFSNLGSPVGFNCCTGWTEGGSTSEVGLIIQAMAYTTPSKPASTDLTSIEIALGYVNGTNGATLETVADKSGEPTGKTLAKCSISNMPTFGSTSTEVSTCKITKKVALKAKTQYWLVPLVESNEWGAWNLADSGSGNGCYTTNGTSWTCTNYSPQGAFGIFGKSAD